MQTCEHIPGRAVRDAGRRQAENALHDAHSGLGLRVIFAGEGDGSEICEVRRAAAEQELNRIEDELKAKMMEIRS